MHVPGFTSGLGVHPYSSSRSSGGMSQAESPITNRTSTLQTNQGATRHELLTGFEWCTCMLEGGHPDSSCLCLCRGVT